jgi:hypothetical protein
MRQLCADWALTEAQLLVGHFEWDKRMWRIVRIQIAIYRQLESVL